jgi:hypothetical protein
MNKSVITKKASEALQLGKNGSYSNEGNVLQHVLYDNLDFQDTTVRANGQFFTAPINSTYMGGSKTETETNLENAGQLPNTQTFLINEISFSFLPSLVDQTDVDASGLLQDYVNIMQASRFEIKIAGRDFDLQVPGSVFFPPVFFASNGTRTTATDTLTPAYGQFISTGWVKLASTPIPVGNLVNFSVRMSTSVADTALATILNTSSDNLATQNAQMQCRLKGVLTRSI